MRSTEPLRNDVCNKSERRRCDRKETKILSCLRHFYCLWVIVLQAFRTACSIPAYNLSSLRDFFYEMPQGDVSTGYCCKKKRLFFLHVALGIAAASFAKLGLQTSDFRLRIFLSEAEMKRAKIERKARRLCRNAIKKLKIEI